MTRARSRRRSGLTLVELLVTLAVLGIAASVVTLALPRATAPAPETPSARVVAARREALERGRSVAITVHVGQVPVDVTANVDGSVVADTALRFDRLTGKSANATAR